MNTSEQQSKFANLKPGDLIGVTKRIHARDASIIIKAGPVERITPKRVIACGYEFSRETGASAGKDRWLCYSLTVDLAKISAYQAELAANQAARAAAARQQAELEATPRWQAAEAVVRAIQSFSTAEIHGRYTESQLTQIAEILNEPINPAP